MFKFTKINLLLLFISSSFFAQGQKPVPVCFTGLSADMMAGGKVTLPANIFNAGSYDSKFATKDLLLRVQSPAPLAGTPYDATKASKDISFDCIGQKSVALWVGNPDGVWEFCLTFIDIQNNLNIPNVPNCGKLVNNGCTSPNDKKVSIQLGKIGNCATLGEFGYYIAPTNFIPALTKFNPVDKNTVCTPTDYFLSLKINPKFTNKTLLNGVTTLDMVLISKHILGNKLLTNPIEKVAADINNNGSITTADIVALRKCILGIDTAFQNNDSWKFIAPDGNVLQKNAIVSFQIKSDTTLKYGAVKIGDVNLSADCTLAAPRDFKTHLFDIEEKRLNKDEIYTLSIENQELDGYQFTLKYDDTALELIEIDENSLPKGSNRIVTSQLQGEQFKATFRAKKEVALSEIFRMSSSKIVAEAYKNEEIFIVDFNFVKRTNTGFFLGQNQPNPFNDKTQIEFFVTQKSDYQLVVFDAIGREIKNTNGKAEKGSNILELEMQEKGIYFYQLKVDGQSAVKKMIVE